MMQRKDSEPKPVDDLLDDDDLEQDDDDDSTPPDGDEAPISMPDEPPTKGG